MDPGLRVKLDQIRSQATSKLENQANVARTLSAVDDVLKEQRIEANPNVYLVTLLSLLSSSISAEVGDVNTQLAAPVVYLIDTILEFVPPETLRTNYSHIVPSLAIILENQSTGNTHSEGTAALIRSALGALERVLIAQDDSTWKSREEHSVQLVFTSYILGYSLDPRPKVRKRALDAIKHILTHPSVDRKGAHPAAEGTAALAFHTAQAQFGQSKKRKGKDAGERDVKAVHSLNLLKVVADSLVWPKSSIQELVEFLLNLSSENYDNVVRLTALDCFEVIFARATKDNDTGRIREVLEMVLAIIPSKTDTQLIPSWLAVVAAGFRVYAITDVKACLRLLPGLLRQLFAFLQVESEDIRAAVGSALVALAEGCLTTTVSLEQSQEPLQEISELALQGLTTRYQLAWRDVFRFIGALFLSLRWKADPLFLDSIKIIEAMRSKEGFEGKAEAEAVIGAAIEGVGPASVLKIIPLNLERQGPTNPGRAWLLPILKAHVKNTRLGHFKEYFVPLSERLYQKVIEGESNQTKTMELKVLETVVEQIWSLLPSYCNLPIELEKDFDQSFAELLANILYQQVNLRSTVCHALTNLIEKNNNIIKEHKTLKELAELCLKEGEPERNIQLLASFSPNFLSVLFNVFSQTVPSFRSPITDCIRAFLKISSAEDLRATLAKVMSLLHENLKKATKEEKSELPTLAQTAIDLTTILIPYLPEDSFATLWAQLHPLLQTSTDPNIQRRLYRCLSQLAETEGERKLFIHTLSQIQEILNLKNTQSSCQKDRILALQQIVHVLPTESLHLITTILPEAIIGTKEANQNAREAAYDLLITMGRKMQQGGTVDNKLLDGMDLESKTASVEEYFLMVSAGLGGSTQHMVSATITALSRLLYEFKYDLSDQVVNDLISTMEIFLTSKSREIARSAIGFFKVAVVSLPKRTLESRLANVVPNLMVWSHEAKGHFRVKVKGLMDRMVRKFGYETVLRYTPEEDHKLVNNIRKTRERKRRGKAKLSDDDEQEEETLKTTKGQSAYDDVLYGSDSDLYDSEDDEMPKPSQKQKKGSNRQKRETFIREESNEPVDLLDQKAFSHVTSRQPLTKDEEFRRRAKAASLASTFKSTHDGKMIIDEDAGKPENARGKGEEKVYNAYEEAHESKDMAKRGYRDRVTFSNKRSRQEAEDFDVEMPDAYGEGEKKGAPAKKKQVVFDGRRGNFQKRKGVR